MTKIGACCNWHLKFIGPILDWWREAGHEVKYELGYNPEIHEWADVYFVDVCDNNAKVASQNRFPGSRLVIRVIDIEAWAGQPAAVNWDNVDACIFGAQHIWELVESYVQFPNGLELWHIPFGIDVDKWTFVEDRWNRRDVAWIGRPWIAKGLNVAIQIMMGLSSEWTLHCLMDDFKRRDWYGAYIHHIIEESNLNVEITKSVKSVDEWLDGKDYIIVSSVKEAFSYAAAEAMAKGIKPLIHNFWRASDIWPREFIWNSVDDALAMIHNMDYNSAKYRQFVAERYSLDRMMAGLNEVCQL